MAKKYLYSIFSIGISPRIGSQRPVTKSNERDNDRDDRKDHTVELVEFFNWPRPTMNPRFHTLVYVTRRYRVSANEAKFPECTRDTGNVCLVSAYLIIGTIDVLHRAGKNS